MTEEVHATFTLDFPGPPPGIGIGQPGRLINRDCTIRNPVPTETFDERGNEITTEGSFPTVCEIQQVRRDETTEQGTLATATWVGFFPAGTEIFNGSTVTTDDDNITYEVDGDPWIARNPRTQTISHIETTLKLVQGAVSA